MPNPSENTEPSPSATQDRRINDRADPFEILVEGHTDIVGLIAYSIFRAKKKQILTDGNDRTKHFFFDSTAEPYSRELRSVAEAWYNEFHLAVEAKNYQKYEENVIKHFLYEKIESIIENQKLFPWKRSIISSTFGTIFFGASFIILSFFMNYYEELNPFSIWESINNITSKFFAP